MALTDNCDIFGALHEDGINSIVRHAERQRPSLFNYATDFFVRRPDLLCQKIEAHPEVIRRNNPLITKEAPLAIPGTGGRIGLDFCVQIVGMAIDFHPENAVPLPPELSPLHPQRASVTLRACAGLVCPDERLADAAGDALVTDTYSKNGVEPDPAREELGMQPVPKTLPGEVPTCFCLEAFGVLRVDRLNIGGTENLVLRLDGFEIVDISPNGLEQMLECYTATTLRVGILPKLRIAADTLVFELGDYLTLNAGLTPPSASVPNNPAIEQDVLKVFIDLGIS